MILDEQLRQALAFHLREISADLGMALVSLRLAAHAPNAATASAHLLNARASVEHDVEHHLLEAMSLLGMPANADVSADAQVEEESRAQVEPSAVLEQVASQLDDANLGALDDPLACQEALSKVRSALVNARDAIDARYRESVALADMADPTRAAARRSDDLMASPQRELRHRDARSLSSCPRCRNPLTSEDRTHEGSFCEHCGTLWTAS